LTVSLSSAQFLNAERLARETADTIFQVFGMTADTIFKVFGMTQLRIKPSR